MAMVFRFFSICMMQTYTDIWFNRALYKITFDYHMCCVSMVHYSSNLSARAFIGAGCQVGNEFLMLLLDICWRFCPSHWKIRHFCYPKRQCTPDGNELRPAWGQTSLQEKKINVLTWKIIFDKIKLNNNKIFLAAVMPFTSNLWKHLSAELLLSNEYECFRWNWAH